MDPKQSSDDRPASGGDAGTGIDSDPPERGSGGGAQDAQSSSPPAAANDGPEHIDEDAAPVPAAAAAALFETTKGAVGGERRPVGVETIDEDGWPLPPELMAAQLADGAPKTAHDGPEQIPNDGSGDEPFVVVPPAARQAETFNVDAEASKKVHADHDHATRVAAAPVVVQPEAVEGPGERDSDLQITTVSNPRFLNFVPGARRERQSEGEGGDEEEPAYAQVSTNAAPPRGGSVSVHDVAEAYAVDDEVIIATHAEPHVPWWKQRKARLILAIFVVALAAMAVALGLALGRSNEVQPQVAQSVGTSSSFPSTSHAPSSSLAPSSMPTDCAYTITSELSTQKVDLSSPNVDYVKTAMDGPKLVVAYGVSRGATWILYLEFFKLQNGAWERVQTPVELVEEEWHTGYDIALRGRTAAISLRYGDHALRVLKQSPAGTWEEVASPEPSQRFGCEYGELMGIDGDLLVVADYYPCYNGRALLFGVKALPPPVYENAVYIFKEAGDEWLEIALLPGGEGRLYSDVAVKGSRIAIAVCSSSRDGGCKSQHWVEVYHYDPMDDSVSQMQKLEPKHNIRSITIVDNNLLLLSGPDDRWDGTLGKYVPSERFLLLYQSEGAHEQFTLAHSFNSSEYDDGFGRAAYALDADHLVVGSNNKTHVFSERADGTWQETLTLDKSFDGYQLSSRMLIATDQNEVKALDISDCAQPVPTQRPSLSIAPTASCHRVTVQITNACYGLDCDWGIAIQRRTLIESDTVDVVTYSHLDANVEEDSDGAERQALENSTCLYPGLYQFVFHGEVWSSLNFYSDTNYRVESDGLLIVQERVEWEWSDGGIDKLHRFDIPFVAGLLSNAPTGSPLPQRQTPSPDSSPSPLTVFPIFSPAFVCLTQSECEEQMQSGGFADFRSGTFPDFGCFSKGDSLFWGTGGTDEQMAIDSLSGTKERVWCG